MERRAAERLRLVLFPAATVESQVNGLLRILVREALHKAAHGHLDGLGIVVFAYGRQLIVDPGIYIYGTPAVFFGKLFFPPGNETAGR